MDMIQKQQALLDNEALEQQLDHAFMGFPTFFRQQVEPCMRLLLNNNRQAASIVSFKQLIPYFFNLYITF